MVGNMSSGNVGDIDNIKRAQFIVPLKRIRSHISIQTSGTMPVLRWVKGNKKWDLFKDGFDSSNPSNDRKKKQDCFVVLVMT